MDAGRLEQQVASVDRGIAFLKQEHLAMLTGLQLEITHLKRRCHGQSTGDLSTPLPPLSLHVSLNHLTTGLSHCLIFFFCLCACCVSPLVSELSCELDSRFPGRNTEGKTFQLFADKRENGWRCQNCISELEESTQAVQRKTGNS